MNRRESVRIYLCVVLASGWASAGAQVSTEEAPDRAVLKSGRQLVGSILQETDDALVFDDQELGELKITWRRLRGVLPRGKGDGIFSPEFEDATKEDAPESYARVDRAGEDRPGALSTGVSRWHDAATGTTVFLVGAVHIAEMPYYRRLQRALDACDVVLFEGVGRKKDGSSPSKEDLERLDSLRQMQLALGRMLDLKFQMDEVDYQRSFWKNADVDFETLTEEMKAKKVELPTDNRFFRMVMKLLLGFVDPEAMSKNPSLARGLRRQTAGLLAGSEKLMSRMGAFSKVLIEYRNEKAMEVLVRELEGGKRGRWIAIFYGAAHLPDLNRRLEGLGFSCGGAAWFAAWTL